MNWNCHFIGKCNPSYLLNQFLIYLFLDGANNHSDTNLSIQKVSLRRNQGLYCLYRPQRKPLQSMLGLFGYNGK